ncbi:response regulator [Paraburkholderia lycopersici]|uniref:DNA-binding response regulator, NarL/FixJ family, contains REC and HTH domains n=1 Tax=Paraburkholderia lycopersici TaxID=416944 RepID=A0A1G7CXB3_9BURK|nr:response regulator transcription factor [Paraburkholderia lycopersici]SDE43938.1 DNA-binding response regulator, NarL/FixJ family, contains REC and HTH domains [Paraburkholderia lycopersici]
MIKVLLADDHALMRDSLRHILQNAGGFEVAGEAEDGATTLAMVRSTDADVLLLDLSMPGRSGVELISQIRKEQPPLRILVVTMHEGQDSAVRACRAGASGYLTKDSASGALIGAVTKVASGGVYMSRSVAERFAQNLNEPVGTMPHQRLSDREFEIFRAIAEGKSLTKIADELHLSVKTVSTHKLHILEKMESTTDNGLIRYAIRHRLFDDEGDGQVR